MNDNMWQRKVSRGSVSGLTVIRPFNRSRKRWIDGDTKYLEDIGVLYYLKWRAADRVGRKPCGLEWSIRPNHVNKACNYQNC